MKIPILNSYNTYSNNNADNSLDIASKKPNGLNGSTINESIAKVKDEIVLSKESLIGNKINPEKIITKQERKFFIKMFPESSAVIENHILFNRNGKVTNPQISKGMIVDGKV
ncbi:MAG: hypothetical protein KGZ71_06230 [Desulfobulbaceae bacterium]|nr:hypothetical protein [Candidatus Kapabacteria bacterium]MBS4000060.1 hypothetical protein [Desulfobulbaceae bacterium]